MKENGMDVVRARLKEQYASVISRAKELNKGRRQFNTPDMPPEMQIYYFDSLNVEQLNTLAQKYGPQSVMALHNDIEKMRVRRQQ